MAKYVQDRKTGKFMGSLPDKKRNIPTAAPSTSSSPSKSSSSVTNPALVPYEQRIKIVKSLKKWHVEGRDVVLDGPTGFYVDRETGEILDLED